MTQQQWLQLQINLVLDDCMKTAICWGRFSRVREMSISLVLGEIFLPSTQGFPQMVRLGEGTGQPIYGRHNKQDERR